MTHCPNKLFMGVVVCFMLITPLCHAYTMAILPVANLSKGRNGVDLDITAKLAQQLRNDHFSIVDSDQVMSFMIEHAVRRCGEMDTLTCRIMAEQLKCDVVLVSTILEDHDNQSSSLMLTVYNGESGQGVWSTVFTEHMNDKQPFLGLGKTDNFDQLQQNLLVNVSSFLTQNPVALPQLSTKTVRDYHVSDIQITPHLVRGQSDLNCRLKIRFIGEEPDYLQLSSGDNTTILHRSAIAQTYEGTLEALALDGSYPVDLKLHWGDDHHELLSKVTSYQVANNPPQLDVRICSGLNIGEVYAFSDRVKLLPSLTPARPVDCWQFTVTDENGRVVMSEKHSTPLPEQLQWRGTDNNRRRLDVGRYEMGLSVWDIAGNLATNTATLYLQPKEIDLVTINQQFHDNRHQLELLPAKNTIIPIDHWAISLETDQGEIVYTTHGNRLPALVSLPENLNYDQLSCTVKAIDELGNNTLLSGTRFQITGSNEMLAQRQNTFDWRADF